MSQYSIKDLEQLSGIKAHTLRVWEQRYQIISPKRTKSNIRFYDNHDLKLVLNISVLNDHGFKISRIARMTEAELHQEVVRLSQEFCRYPDQIQSLTLAMIDMDEVRFERTMASNIMRIGLERTMLEVVYPFLQRIGILWQTGAINPAQEHFITNLVRQKLIVAIDGQTPLSMQGSKLFVLFLPEGELHELGLLFASYLIKSRGHRVCYLGQSLPVPDLIAACNAVEPDYLFGIFSSHPSVEIAKDYLDRVLSSCGNDKVLVSGSLTYQLPSSYTSHLKHFRDASEMIHFLDGDIPDVIA